jgi:hypothetical protein
MPIRHCQKCGLKVLIDESQAGANPFYCQRCTTAMKQGDGGSSPEPAAMAKTPVPAVPDISRPATVKVLCPYCKASFNGRVPQKPARGACPVCQKELILLPTGDIRPAAGFDVARWQEERKKGVVPAPAAPEKETGTKLLIKKYSAQQAMAKPAPAPEPAPVTVPAETEGAAPEAPALPSWLDDKQAPQAVAAPPAEPEEPQTEPEPPPPEAEPAAAEAEPPPPPPEGPEAPPEPAPSEAGDLLKNVQEIAPPPRAASRPPAAMVPAPEPEPEPEPPKPVPAARKPSTLRRSTDRRVAPGAVATGPVTGAGKVLLAYILLLLPAAACPFLYQDREKLKGGAAAGHSLVERVGVRLQKGFLALSQKLSPPPPAPPPPPPPKPEAPPEEKPKPTAEEEARDKDEILRLWTEFKREERTFKQRLVGASDAEKASEEFKAAEAAVKQKEERIRVLRENFKKLYGKDVDPTKE